MIRGKETFIANVSRCLGRDSLPGSAPVFSPPSEVQHEFLKNSDQDELQQVFKKNSEANGTLFFECSREELAPTLLQALKSFDSGSVVIGDHAYFRDQGVIEAMQEQIEECYLWNTANSREENIQKAETAMVGISMAEMGLAESGTVILFSHQGTGRSVSLLPTYAITVLRKRDLRPRLTQGMAFLRSLDMPLPASVNFVSGASSTADIELVPVKGVHGPLKIAYVLVDD
jgi:L-lactate dehydrogenase complex protein LldG